MTTNQKTELTKIKDLYKKEKNLTPFTKNGDVTVDFMFFVVEYYDKRDKKIIAEIEKIIK